MWSIDQKIEELQFHIDSLRSIILANAMDANPWLDLQRTLSFAMGIMREKREALIYEQRLIDERLFDSLEDSV